MIETVPVSMVTYGDFCREVRERVADVNEERLLHEWCLYLSRVRPWSYDRIAKEIRTVTPKRLYRDIP